MSFRGPYHRRRNGRRNPRFGPGKTNSQDAALPTPSASQRRIEEIDTNSVDTFPNEKLLPEIQEVKLVASFSWKDTRDSNVTTNTILVPGELASNSGHIPAMLQLVLFYLLEVPIITKLTSF